MNNMESRYFDSSYLAENPDWDRQDAPWKANQVLSILSEHQLQPLTVCEIGCGSGDILAHLLKSLPDARMTGFDISPQVLQFWEQHQDVSGLQFHLGDFHKINQDRYDLLLMLDVFEHVPDPFSFLDNSRSYADYFIFHIPLDLSASSVARDTNTLLRSRSQVGHLHYYTKNLALATLQDTGYEIINWRYTGAYLNVPNRSLKTRLAAIPRQLLCAFNKDLGVRLLGGETLIVLAKST
jgi:SAM-dependent methyltransferase